MKGGLAAAAAAAMVGSASALSAHRNAHHMFARHEDVCVPSCTTIWTTITGQATLVPQPPKTTAPAPAPPAYTAPAVPEPPVTTETPAPVAPVTTETPAPVAPTTTKVVPVVPVPTPEVHDCPTPGTYTFPATTITVDKTTTVCGAQTTKVPAGTHTVGGVTTVVETATTVTCPVAKVTTQEGGVVTSVIETTVYVCPTPGTYTIEPLTTTVTEETIIVYPVPTSYAPGTYTAPAQTVTVTETGYVYVCPFTSEGLPTSTAAPPKQTYEVPAPPKEVTQAAVPPKVTSESPKETYEAPAPPKETTKVPAPPKSSSTPSKPTNGGTLGGGDHYGITYTPYTSSGQCKGSADVDKDIAALKQAGFSVVRVYSTDCNTLENVGNACRKHGMGMMIGVFVKGGSSCSYSAPDIKEQVDAIAKWAQWDLVKLFVVGNEAMMNGFCTATELRDLITTVKSKCSTYTGSYTIAETLNIWEREDVQQHICGVVDVTGANIHPYFNAEVTPSNAGTFVAGQLDLLQKICPGNQAINLECGWPTQGSCNGAACPGKKEQAQAIKSIRESCGDKTVFFSFEDDMWKEPGSCGCEQSWGSKDCFLS